MDPNESNNDCQGMSMLSEVRVKSDSLQKKFFILNHSALQQDLAGSLGL